MSETLGQYYREESALDNNNSIIDLPTNNSISSSFRFKQQIREEIGNGGTRNVNFLRTLEILFINCEINLQLIDTKLYVPVITLSIQSNVKLLKQLESGFKRTINWSKY